MHRGRQRPGPKGSRTGATIETKMTGIRRRHTPFSSGQKAVRNCTEYHLSAVRDADSRLRVCRTRENNRLIWTGLRWRSAMRNVCARELRKEVGAIVTVLTGQI